MDDLLNKIFNEDCLEGMKRIPDKSIDMVLCDMPYGITNCKWDSVIDLDKMWIQLKRIIKIHSAIVLTSAQPFTSRLVTSNLKMFKYEWVWVKSRITGVLNAKKMPVRNHELILIFGQSSTVYNPQGLIKKGTIINQGRSSENYRKRKTESYVQEFTNYPRDVLEIASAGNPVHPTQKPVALMEYLIKTYTNEKDVVLDFCMGSGTTAIAAINTNRNYIGFENDEKYFNLAMNRIKDNLIPATEQEAREAGAKVMAKYGKALDNLAKR